MYINRLGTIYHYAVIDLTHIMESVLVIQISSIYNTHYILLLIKDYPYALMTICELHVMLCYIYPKQDDTIGLHTHIYIYYIILYIILIYLFILGHLSNHYVSMCDIMNMFLLVHVMLGSWAVWQKSYVYHPSFHETNFFIWHLHSTWPVSQASIGLFYW